MTVRIRKRDVFYFLLLVLMALVLARYGFQINVPRMLLTVVLVLIAILGDKDEALAIALCCMPLHNAVNFYVSLVSCAVIYVLKNGKSMRFDLSILLIMAMVIWELTHCFTTEFNLKLFFVDVSTLVLLLVVLNTDLTDLDYTFIARIVSIVMVVISLVTLILCYMEAGRNIVDTFSNLQRLGTLSTDDALLGTAINPNALGILSVLSVSSLFQIRQTEKKKRIDDALIVLLIVSALLTASRTAVVCLCIMTFMLLMARRGRIVQKIRFIVAIVAMIAVIVLAYVYLFPENFEYLLSRFESDDTGSGRTWIFEDYNQYMVENLWVMFWGVGLNNFQEKVMTTYNMSTAVPHNGIQEIVVAWGIPGLILVTLLITVMIAQSKKYGTRKTLLNYIPLIILLSKSMAGQFITSGYTMLALAFAYLSLCQDFTPTDRLDNTSL